MRNNIEVLSPAGSYDTMVAAVNAGADAVYLGGSAFGARAYANNFDTEELLRAIDYIHLHNRKIYLTVNTLLKNDELMDNMYNYIKPYYEQGLDAVIVQDMGVFSFIRNNFPNMDIHASTQMSITGVNGAKLMKELGASRVVTARELNFEEIKEIHDNVDIEIESFVHGALCYCYSGQCLLSSMIGGRSGNRGRCAQPCRLPYDVEGMNLKEKYLLSPKDMSTLNILPQVIEAGVYSLKIEGRMKSSEYTAGVVGAYRKYVDKYFEFGKDKYRVDPQDINDLCDLYNRGGFTEGYYSNKNGRDMISFERPNHMGTKALKVVANKKGSITFKALEPINRGDIFEINKDNSFTSGVEVATNGEFNVNLPSKYNLKIGDILFRTKNGKLANEIADKYIDNNITEPVKGEMKLFEGEPAYLKVTLLNSNISAEVTGDIVQSAMKQPMTIDKIEKQINKTGGSGFAFKELDIDMGDNIFMPVAILNDLRRNAFDMLIQNVIASHKRTLNEQVVAQSSELIENRSSDDGKNRIYNVSINRPDSLDIIVKSDIINSVYLDYAFYSLDTLKQAVDLCKSHSKKVYIRMPHIFRMAARKIFDKDMSTILDMNIDGLLVKSLDELKYLAHFNRPINAIIDNNVYTYNQVARAEIKLGLPENVTWLYDTAPLELNEGELGSLGINSSELVIYGKAPVMVSAQCVKKTIGKCDGGSNSIVITDRKKAAFTVQSFCKYCYSVMYNSSPLYLLDKLDTIEEKLNPGSYRLEFSDENNEQIKIILDSLENTRDVELDYTRGHFYRGIE